MMQQQQQGMGPQQAQQQAGPGPGPGQAPGGKKSYPQTEEQMQKFIFGVFKMIHSTEEFVKPLADDQAPIAVRIGFLSAQVVNQMMMTVKQQTGLPVNHGFAVNVIQTVIKEFATMAEVMGQKPTQQDLAKAAKIAGDNIEQTMQGVYSGRQQQPQPQQQQQPQPQMQPQQAMQQQGGM